MHAPRSCRQDQAAAQTAWPITAIIGGFAALALAASVGGCGDDGGGSPSADVAADVFADVQVPGGPDAVSANEDPCGGVPATGRCVAGDVELCATPTGNSEPSVFLVPCHGDEVCQETPAGARCVLDAACYSGSSECRGAQLATCQGGAWVETPCSGGCFASSLGAACRPNTTTALYEGSLVYELRVPNEQLSDWSPQVLEAPAQGFLVLSYADGVLVDSVVTSNQQGAEGRFQIQAVPANQVDGDDFLVAMAARPTSDNRLAYIVADPGFGAGVHDMLRAPDQAQTWLWSWTADQILTPALVRIPIDAGSGAAHVYDYLRLVYDFAEQFYGPRSDAPLVVWLGFGSNWQCGACFAPWPVQPFDGAPFTRQVWIPGGADEAYWGGPVIAHELGHYVMGTYGTSPGEGGQHFFGVPSHPGLSWSEGFATWFSAVVRGSAVYYDKQQGGFFWMNLVDRAYSGELTWQRPVAGNGLQQLIDENEVSAMLLGLTNEQTLPGMLGVIALPRMTQRPFSRGYFRRAWEGLNAQGLPIPYSITNESAPFVADYFDALLCNQVVAPNAVDAVTSPQMHFPYPSAFPLCQHAGLPLDVACAPPIVAGAVAGGGAPSEAASTSVSCTLRWRVALDQPLEARLALPPGVELAAGPVATVVPAGAEPGERVLSWVLDGAPADVGRVRVEVATGGTSWGYRAEVPFAPEAAPRVVRDGFRVRVGERDFGRAVALPAEGPIVARPRAAPLRGPDITP